jgi:hypothetical protein
VQEQPGVEVVAAEVVVEEAGTELCVVEVAAVVGTDVVEEPIVAVVIVRMFERTPPPQLAWGWYVPGEGGIQETEPLEMGKEPIRFFVESVTISQPDWQFETEQAQGLSAKQGVAQEREAAAKAGGRRRRRKRTMKKRVTNIGAFFPMFAPIPSRPVWLKGFPIFFPHDWYVTLSGETKRKFAGFDLKAPWG